MHRRRFILYGSSLVYLVALVVVLYFALSNDSSGQKKTATSDKVEQKTPMSTPMVTLDDEDPMKLDPEMALKFWPDIKDRENRFEKEARVQAQWEDFIKKYPKNIFIPPRFQKPSSTAEKQHRRKMMDTVSEVDAYLDDLKRKIEEDPRYGPDKAPQEIELKVKPEQQKLYFEYKILALESKLQLMEFTRSRTNLSASQNQRMNESVSEWQTELTELQKAQATLPN